MNDAKVIEDFIAEHISVVDEEKGAVVGATLLHHHGIDETEIYAVTAAKNGNLWGKPAEMAQMFDRQATRHARGVVAGGAQQFRLMLFRSPAGSTTGEKLASHVLPFSRFAPQSAMMSPNGAPLASEPPTNMGLIMQGQRYLEQDKTNVHAMEQFLFNLLATENERLRRDNQEAHADGRKARMDERMTAEALMQLGMRMSEMLNNRQIEALKFQRNMILQAELLKLTPNIINLISGQETFPASTEHTALIRLIHGHMDPAMRQKIVDDVGHKNAPAGAALADGLAKLDREAAEDAEEWARLARAATGHGGTEEASGDMIAQTRGAPVRAGAGSGGSNGHVREAEVVKEDAMALSDIVITRKHGASKSEARTVVDALAKALAAKVSVTASWDGDRLVLAADDGPAKGIRGIVEVDDAEIRLRVGDLPLKFRMAKGMIEDAIVKDLEALIRSIAPPLK